MPISSVHPEYRKRTEEWKMVRASLEGERAVKDETMLYLPAPPGMKVSTRERFASSGQRTTGIDDRYFFYLGFAEFPEIIEPALNGFQGIIHAKPPQVKLPASMEYLVEDATPDGESLQMLWQRTTREIISGGRVGMLCDTGDDGDQLRIASYSVENITNWKLTTKWAGMKPEFVVLREMSRERDPDKNDDFETTEVVFWRELRVDENGIYQMQLWVKRGRDADPVIEEPWEPVSYFGKPLTEIPFLSVNALDHGFGYGAVPLVPLTRRAMSIYRLTADYRRSLYIKGDPQTWISGIQKSQAPAGIGGGALWVFENPDAKAGYLDIDGKGIPLMREAIGDQYDRFWEETGRLLQSGDRGAESGEALRRRQIAKQVTLQNLVINAGNGLLLVLKKIAALLGEDPKSIQFDPDIDFAMPQMTGQMAFEWAQAQNAGFPISDDSLHRLGRRGGATEKTFEQEKAARSKDQDDFLMPPPTAPPVPNLDNRNAEPPDGGE